MNELFRTVVAGAAGAALTIAVLVGQPALADQVDKAKAKKVTSAMIKNGTIQRKDLNSDVSGALTKADTALQGIADNSVTTQMLANGAVTGPKIADNSVSGAKVPDNAVTSSEVADNAITSSELADNAVASSEMADNAIGSSEVTDGSLTAGDLGQGSVTSSEIADGSLVGADIGFETGTFIADVPSLNTNQCATIGPFSTGTTLDNDLILLSNPVTVAGAIQVSARQQAAGSSGFFLIACNGAGAFDAPSATFSYLVIKN